MNAKNGGVSEEGKLKKAGRFHFYLLLAIMVSFSLVFLLSGVFQSLMVFVVAILLLLFVVSHVNLQFYQKCSECGVSIKPSQIECYSCGKKVLSVTRSDKEWFQK